MQPSELPKLKRIHLFEFEDFPWFPNWIRVCMTRYIMAFHKILETEKHLEELIEKTQKEEGTIRILDLCSGSGGPMPGVHINLRSKGKDVSLELSDLYPNLEAAHDFNTKADSIRYHTDPVDATKPFGNFKGLVTMVSSLHHMPPLVAKKILKNVMEQKQNFLAFEISDNKPPIAIWWLAIPFAFITSLFLTPLVRPMTWQQLVFTYLIPVIPLFIAWDGAVSNARTYTVSDLKVLTADLQSDQYQWEIGTVKGKGGGKVFLIGHALT